MFPWVKLKGQFIMQNKVEAEVKKHCCSVSKVVFDSLQPHGLQHARLPCPSLSPRVCSHSCPLSWWCHPTISSSVTLFSSCPQSFPASESFPTSQLFASGGQNTGVSASVSVLPMNIQGWFPLGLRSKNYAFFALMKYFLFLNINYIWHKLIC